MNVTLSINADLQDIFIINTLKGDLYFLDGELKVIFALKNFTKTSFRVPINLFNNSKLLNEGDHLLIAEEDKIIISVWNKEQFN